MNFDVDACPISRACRGFNNMYCDEVLDAGGIPAALPWTSGYACVGDQRGAHCVTRDDAADTSGLECPQLPKTSPAQLSKGHKHGQPPAAWTCDPDAYFELDKGATEPTCDCGCGIIGN